VKEPLVRLELITGEVIVDLMLSALALEYARENLGFMRPEAGFRLFLDDEEVSQAFPPEPRREVDSGGFRNAHGGQGGEIPAVAFTRWYRWRERISMGGVALPGVYLLAQFQIMPDGPADPTEKQIVYIGATDRPLVERWRDFDRVVAGKAGNHSGGKTYRKIFGHRVDDLYVAALPVSLDKKFSWRFSSYVEAKLLWEVVWQWELQPACNRD